MAWDVEAPFTMSWAFVYLIYISRGGTITDRSTITSSPFTPLGLHCFYTSTMFRKKKPQAVPKTISQSHLSIPMQPVDDTKDVEAIEFEPVPTPVDFSGMKPTARYQTRAVARRALSFHARQRITNGICLIIWPILMALLNYFLATLIAGEYSDRQGVFRMCVNEVNPQRSRFVAFGDQELSPEEVAHGFNASYYLKTDRLWGYYTYHEPCVRWFGESHPNQPPYMNGTGNGVDT